MTTASTLHIAGLDGELVSLTAEQIEVLRSALEGSLLGPGDDGWSDAVSSGTAW